MYTCGHSNESTYSIAGYFRRAKPDAYIHVHVPTCMHVHTHTHTLFSILSLSSDSCSQ